MSYIVEASCRISGSPHLEEVIDLGKQPLANSLKTSPEEKEKIYPLSASFCSDTGLLQLDQTVDRTILFSEYYWVTGTSRGAQDWAGRFVRQAVEAASLNVNDLIIEIASNDGTFLRRFFDSGYRNILGIEPAKNIAAVANESGIRTIPQFWGKQLAKDIIREHNHAKLIIARNVIAHVSDLLGAVEGIADALSIDGVGAIEFHYAGEILRGLQYDSIYHEHLCYFSVQSFRELLNKFGLHPFHVVHSPISGGALVVLFSKKYREESAALAIQRNEEEKSGVNKISAWKAFSKQIAEHRSQTIDLLDRFQGRQIVGFGSSARSQTYLNYCQINSSDIAAIIDNNRMKQGYYTAGGSIPIVSVEQGLALEPDFVFVLAWNFLDEIVAECRNLGYRGEYLSAFPNEIRRFSTL
jgi:hypothetical protein